MAKLRNRSMGLMKLLEDFPYEPYFVVRVPEEALRLAGYDFLYEGEWRESRVSDLWVRVDAARPEISLQRHAHVAHKKHISSKNAQVSWNGDGSRHDLKSFNTNFKGIEKAKEVTRAALGLPQNFILEHIPNLAGELLMLHESQQSLPDTAILLKVRVTR